jgi:SAM-dependent methyltransferase
VRTVPDPHACLTVVVPCFNEAATVRDTLELVLASSWTSEVVVVDDGSEDGTAEIVEAVDHPRVRLIRQPCNLGKGAALRRGFQEATAPFVIVQDADREYDPADWDELLAPLLNDQADVVYGSRFHSHQPHRVLYFWHSVGNRLLTFLSNANTNLNLTDMETCYKVFRREVIQGLDLREDRFGFEPEVTAKIAAGRWRVFEVGISYQGRTYDEGKKIGWRDGFRALWCIVRYSPAGERAAAGLVRTPNPAAEPDHHLAPVLEVLEEADAYADWVMSLLRPHVGGDILEIGAGTGTMTKRLVEHGHVLAVEPSAVHGARLDAAVAGEERASVHLDTLESVPVGTRFDTAVLVNVLEHVDDDVGLLGEAAARLRPGATLACFVPAHAWLHSRFDDRVGHVRRYRRSQLAEAFQRAGLDLVELRYVNAPGAVAWWAGARVLGLMPSPWTTRLYQRAVLPVIASIERDRRPPFGQSLVAVGRVGGA